MSLVASAQRFMLLCVLLATLGEYALGIEVVGDNPTWNYNQHGQDWDFANCNVKTEVQSPYELVSTAGQYFGRWTLADLGRRNRFQECSIWQALLQVALLQACRRCSSWSCLSKGLLTAVCAFGRLPTISAAAASATTAAAVATTFASSTLAFCHVLHW